MVITTLEDQQKFLLRPYFEYWHASYAQFQTESIKTKDARQKGGLWYPGN